MALTINHNLVAQTALTNLGATYKDLSKSIGALSSGLRINSAGDDAAGLAVRELMRANIAAMTQGVRNANDGVSMLQTFDGAASVIDEQLIRMKQLAEQAATGTYDDTQRGLMQAAESQISDVDVAWEITQLTRNQVVAQAGVAMLAQANQIPMLALKLLG